MSSFIAKAVILPPKERFSLMKSPTIIYILGAGHSGSTLLNFLLNGHAQIVGLNEIQEIRRYLGDKARDARLSNDFWQAVKQRYEASSQAPFRSVVKIHWRKAPIWSEHDKARRERVSEPNLVSEFLDWQKIQGSETSDFTAWTQQNQALLAAIAAEANADFVVDASKAWQRLLLLQKSGHFNVKVIHLVRDGRAVVNSYIRKYDSFGVGFGRWSNQAIAATVVQRQFPAEDWLKVRYEDLATQPEAVLQKLCQFLAISYQPEMLQFRQHPYVGIRGNRMAEDIHNEAIVFDQTWKQKLSNFNQFRFMLLGGYLNYHLGYKF